MIKVVCRKSLCVNVEGNLCCKFCDKDDCDRRCNQCHSSDPCEHEESVEVLQPKDELTDGTYVYCWNIIEQRWFPVAICTNYTFAMMLMKYAVDHEHLTMAYSTGAITDEQARDYKSLAKNRWMK